MPRRRILLAPRPLDASGAILAPVLDWDDEGPDTSPDFTASIDALSLVGGVLTLQYSSAADFSSPTEITDTLDAGEISALLVNMTISDLADGTYYFRIKQTRGATVSSWSNTETVTISSGSLAPLFLMMAA